MIRSSRTRLLERSSVMRINASKSANELIPAWPAWTEVLRCATPPRGAGGRERTVLPSHDDRRRRRDVDVFASEARRKDTSRAVDDSNMGPLAGAARQDGPATEPRRRRSDACRCVEDDGKTRRNDPVRVSSQREINGHCGVGWNGPSRAAGWFYGDPVEVATDRASASLERCSVHAPDADRSRAPRRQGRSCASMASSGHRHDGAGRDCRLDQVRDGIVHHGESGCISGGSRCDPSCDHVLAPRASSQSGDHARTRPAVAAHATVAGGLADDDREDDRPCRSCRTPALSPIQGSRRLER